MKLLITILILAVTFSACSNVPARDNTQTITPQIPVLQPPDNSSSNIATQASAQTAAVTQSIETVSATPPISTPENTKTSMETQTPTIAPTTVVTSTSSTGSAIIADHTVIDKFEAIPSDSLAAAAAIKTLFMHQSTGNNIKSIGFDCVAGLNSDPGYYPEECTIFAQISNNPYDYSNWDWPEWSTPMADAVAKADTWVSVANSQQKNYQVLGMKFCYVDGHNQDFENYRQKMDDLERTYPDKAFIWATSALWSESAVEQNLASAETIQMFNQQLRAYAIANNKILYDLADIESHDPNGNPCQSNGFEALCDEYTDGQGGGGGGHPDVDGSIRLTKGFWWLMARISGWDEN